MTDVKFNINQVMVKPPAIWVRLQNALLFFCASMLVLLSTTDIIAPAKLKMWAVIISGFMILIQTIGLFLGVAPQTDTGVEHKVNNGTVTISPTETKS